MPAASARLRCPCGSGQVLADCCGPLLAGQPAPSPERLMRSRYTAFALRDAEYLRDTWHPGRRPDDLTLEPRTRWTGLEIVDAPPPTATRGIVEFRASFTEGGRRGTLHERSRFVLQSGRWWYLDGIVNPGPAASRAS